MNKHHAYNYQEWEAEKQRLQDAKKNKSGTVHMHQVRLYDYALNLLTLENEYRAFSESANEIRKFV